MNKEDRKNLYRLSSILMVNASEVEEKTALVAMKEILDDEPMILVSLDSQGDDITVPPIATILEFTGLTVSELVSIDCWPGITKAMAYKLEAITSYPVLFWLNLEKNYQEALIHEN